AKVTVLDTLPPVAVCQDLTIYLDGSGNASIMASDADNGSSDNCSAILTFSADSTDYDCSELGLNDNFLTVTDAGGNADQCAFTVTVLDTLDPAASCQNIKVHLDVNGIAEITTADVDLNSTDACDMLTLSLDVDSFSCGNVGANQVILTIDDGSGNMDMDTCTVTVFDTIPPVAQCTDIQVGLDANGLATIVANDVNDGSNDACGLSSITIDNNSFTCADTGANTVTLTVTDLNGNVDSCDAIVTIVDDRAPTAICAFGIAVGLDENGMAIVPYTSIDNGSFDNCGICNITLSPDTFTCANVGSNTVFLTVTDCSDNSTTCTTIIDVQDKSKPKAKCQDITVYVDTDCKATITGADINDGSSDNCGIASMVATPSMFTIADLGSNSVVLTVTDVNGNQDTCHSVVTVTDSTAPVAVCKDATIYIGANGMALIAGSMIDGGSSDNCSLAGFSASPSMFTCSDTGANTVMLTVFDQSGNPSAPCSATVTVLDTIPPTAVCMDITVMLDSSGNAQVTGMDIDGGSVDSCGVISLAASPNAFTCADTGANIVTLTVTDASGNTATCDATVTIEDNIAPTAICQDQTVYLDNNGNITADAANSNNGSFDNCSDLLLSLSDSTYTCADTGSNAITLTVADASGNSSTCMANITVLDTTSPNAVCTSITVQLDANGQYIVQASEVDGGSTDNCGVASIALDIDTLGCSNVGANAAVLTVTDAAGNSSTCDATVTAEDNVNPIAVCQDDTVQINAAGEAPVTAVQLDGGSSDACGYTAAIITANGLAPDTTFNCADTGVNPVLVVITDPSGNADTCLSLVTVEKVSSPNASCTDATVELDASGNVEVTVADINGMSSDPCGIDSINVTPSNFDCSDTGVHIVTLIVIDGSGNADSCTANVTISDNLPPTPVCINQVASLDSNGNAVVTAAMVGSSSFDNCGVASIALSDTSYKCSDVGTQSAVLTVTDAAGNSASCNVTINVEDTIAPVTVCNDLSIVLDANGDASISVNDVDGGSADACGIASRTLSQEQFDCSHTGTNTVTLTVTDNNGNTSTCNATVTVSDTIDPNAICQDVNLILDTLGNASISVDDVDNGSSDECGIANRVLSKTMFTCADTGNRSVTLTVTDSSGNVDSCVANVNTVDDLPPNPICVKNISVTLSPTGTLVLPAIVVDNGSFDNCGPGGITLSLVPNSFDCDDIGLNPVVLTATDASGNSAFCKTFIDIQENVNPKAECMDITVFIDSFGNAKIADSTSIDNGSTDNCSIVSYSLSNMMFDCSNLGSANTVVMTVEDQSGNTDTCSASITVVDTIAPTIVCQPATLVLDSNGTGVLNPTIAVASATDNCSIVSYAADPDSFNCADVGIMSVTIMATDQSGNTSSCTASVTVEDNTKPNAVCQNIAIKLDSTGNASISASQINNGSTDACGVTALSVAPSTFNCSNVGSNSVVLTVTDVNGNSSTCSATVDVSDNTNPDAVCQDISVKLDASGNALVTAAMIDNGSSDACGIADHTFDLGISTTDSLYYTCADVGPNPVTLLVSDVNGNKSSCSATVTVQDNTPPTAICQNITVQLDTNGTVVVTTLDIDNGSNDACGIASYSFISSSIVTSDTLDCSDLGSRSYQLFVTDVNGNVSQCAAVVTIADTIDPTITCEDDTIYLDAFGFSGVIDAGKYVTQLDDNCGVVSLTASSLFFLCADLGSNPLTITATDAAGNSASCNISIEVIDTVAPLANCADPIVKLDQNGQYTLNIDDIDAFSFDPCGLASREIDSITYTCADIGLNSVTLTLTDPSGNVATCVSTVTVSDNIPPMADCKKAILYLDSTGFAILDPQMIDDNSTDNCGIETYKLSQDTFDCSNLKKITVTLTVTDSSGNTDACMATVETFDTTAPTAICNDLDVYLDSNGVASILAADIDGGTFDACGLISVGIETSTFDCGDIGQTVIVKLTAVDTKLNASSCEGEVTVIDSIAPRAKCTSITAKLDQNGQVQIDPRDLDGGSTDACGIDSTAITSSQTQFTCSDLGVVTVTVTVFDVNGNSASCTSSINVKDEINPVAVCIQTIGVGLDSASGLVTIPASVVDKGSSDNCGSTSNGSLVLSLIPNTFDCSNLGLNPVTLVVTDQSGNTQHCVTAIEVQDNHGLCPPPPPSCFAPENLSTTNVGFTTATLSYDAAPNAASYIIEGGISGGGFIQLAFNGTTLNAANLNKGTTYVWRVYTVCTNGDTSAPSPFETFTTLLCGTPVGLNTNVTSSTTATLSWNAVPNALGYRVIGGQQGSSNLVSVDLTGNGNTSLNAAGLSSGTTYQWVVYAICSTNPVIISGQSAVQTFTTPTSSAKHDVVSAPMYVSVYPNPNDGQFAVAVSNASEDARIYVYDLVGKEVLSKDVNTNGNTIFDLSGYEKGTYFIRLVSGETHITQRIVIQ
ncbi:MAG: T9SS type A sorting domain-containing protein, partial [Bacteroidia bacterium]|nr:T9SS type A sorting domain-containing protein [Bacteroidia bacterium]